MLNVSKISANRLDIELSGALDADAMRSALDSLVEKSEGVTDGKMLYRISDFEMPTLGAMAVELYQMPKLLGLIGKFEKCAVISDVAWIRTAAEIEGAVFRSLEIKSFALADTEAAEAWLDGRVRDDDDENFPV
ncbi:STAS/SEC14 domain-containing protein [Sulfitobacter sp.]|uniref:STAS/SEC14 domain-containing protein n=1 Tax=Sulfitobacter sp. TaxID=1903071 RepID=UPI003002A42D